eukprot:1151441-Pelagomonas_calceolata.AAC.4
MFTNNSTPDMLFICREILGVLGMRQWRTGEGASGHSGAWQTPSQMLFCPVPGFPVGYICLVQVRKHETIASLLVRGSVLEEELVTFNVFL